MNWENSWNPDYPGFGARQLLLRPLSWLYILGWRSYESIYKIGLKRPFKPRNLVICVGSCLSGGSGKTPLVIFVTQQMALHGQKVVISCNGYRSKHKSGATIAPAGPLEAAEWGDEPALLREALPDVPLIVGRKRAEAAKKAEITFPDHLLLLDDGLQHLPLHKDLNIVLLPTGLNNRHCFPAGPFRQPAGDSHRFDMVLPNAELQIKTHSNLHLPDCETPERQQCRQVQLLVAIARPERMIETVQKLGLEVVRAKLLPDHHPLTDGRLLGEFDTELPILVTEKDWVKLRSRPDVDKYRFQVVEHRASVEPRSAFEDWIHRQLGRRHSERSSQN